MNIVVTGGAGFLGSHIADVLSEQGHVVTVFDIITSPYLTSDQKMIVGDILDEDLLKSLVQNVDVVYHFAGIADIDECARRPVDTVKYNILGTVKLLDACCHAKVKRFVFASSAYVYSDSGFFYRSSKQTCESFIESYHQLHGLEFTCLRYGSLYGDRADDRNSIYKFIKQAMHEGKITYYGTGDEIREYINVRDAAQISVDILASEFANQHITLTGAERMRYKDLLEMIKEMLGNKIEIEILPSSRKAHYKITPYNFSPKLGKKLTSNLHIDMGQGLLKCMNEIFNETREDSV
jgi:UDP-glucose 4-epimerase